MPLTSVTTEPTICVGILQAPEIRFSSAASPSQIKVASRHDADSAGGCFYPDVPIEVNSQPPHNASFALHDVKIGIGFHWERHETQLFEGRLKICSALDNPRDIIAINEIGLERYLCSVISSEMSAEAPIEFLKAHAIASRSWLIRQLQDVGKHSQGRNVLHTQTTVDGNHSVDSIICWHDREDHLQFDVCADDHCQRYQGVTRQTSASVARAVEATRGIVLAFNGDICDARFSKCCGGRTELFSSCWEHAPHPYLESVDDIWCMNANPHVVELALNSYDRETSDYGLWTVTYSASELSELIKHKSGIDFGEIIELRPIERGASGRIVRLLVKGTRRQTVVGKELEIRRWLSPSHLRSSWFDIIHTDANGGSFTLTGRGWGHGVGLCQIGAAAMGAAGKSAPEILRHYFPKAELINLY